MLLIALAVAVLLTRTRQAAALVRANAPMVVFLLYCLVSVLWADYPFVALKRWIRGVADVVMVLVILTDPDPKAAFRWILSRVGFLLVPLSILFIRFYPELGRAYTLSGAPMWTGVGTDKNALGALCMIVGIAMLWSWIQTYSTQNGANRTRRLLAMGTVLLMIVYLLAIVDSKTALMCTVIAAIAIAFRRSFRRPAVLSTFVAGTVAACYAILILGIGGGVLEAIGRDASLTGRTAVWDAVLSFVEHPWRGAGYENFWIGEKLEALERLGGNQAHNGYLEIYLNLGWIGLILLSAVIVIGYRTIMAGLRTGPETSNLRVAFFVICLIYNFSEAAFKMNTPVWLMFLWAVMASPKPQLMAVRSHTRGASLQNRRWRSRTGWAGAEALSLRSV
jgi:O-antigen ligase